MVVGRGEIISISSRVVQSYWPSRDCRFCGCSIAAPQRGRRLKGSGCGECCSLVSLRPPTYTLRTSLVSFLSSLHSSKRSEYLSPTYYLCGSEVCGLGGCLLLHHSRRPSSPCKKCGEDACSSGERYVPEKQVRSFLFLKECLLVSVQTLFDCYVIATSLIRH